MERTYGARRRDIVVGVCVLVVVMLVGIVYHKRRMRRYRAEMLALIRDEESLYGTPEPEKAPTEAAENSFERMVVDAVRQGLASGDDISVSAIASRLNLGEQTFRRRFVAETGKQPKTFVTAIQVGCLTLSLGRLRQTQTASIHRLPRGLPGYLILFDTHAFELQRQLRYSRLPSQSEFFVISKHFTATRRIPPTSRALKSHSSRCNAQVEPRHFTTRLSDGLRSL